MNVIWTALLALSVCYALAVGSPASGSSAARITQGVLDGAENAVAFAIGLVGALSFWSGMLKVAEACGITTLVARALSPLVRRLFPSIPPGHPASASVLMAITANLIGIGNAATPLGLRAMQDLADLNRGSDEASDAMCTFLALSTSGVTVIPSTVIAVRAAAGSGDPAAIVVTTLVATVVSTFAAIVADRAFIRRGRRL